MGRKKIWWNWTPKDIEGNYKEWKKCIGSQTNTLANLSEVKKMISCLHPPRRAPALSFLAKGKMPPIRRVLVEQEEQRKIGPFGEVRSTREQGVIEHTPLEQQVRHVLEKQTPQKKYEFICWLIDELDELFWDDDYKKLRLEVTAASTTKFTGDLEGWFDDEEDLNTFYRIPWLHAWKDYSQFIIPKMEYMLPILCMKIEMCDEQGDFEKIRPSLSIFDDDLLHYLQQSVKNPDESIHIEALLDIITDCSEKNTIMIGLFPLPLKTFDNPKIPLSMIFWYINNDEIPLDMRWDLFTNYASKPWVGEWSEEFFVRTICGGYDDGDPNGWHQAPHSLFARMFFISLHAGWNKTREDSEFHEKTKTYMDRLSGWGIEDLTMPEDYEDLVQNDQVIIEHINKLLNHMAKEPKVFSEHVGQSKAWQELLVLFRAEYGIEVPCINEPLHNSSELTDFSLLLNLLGHGLEDPPEDIASWAKLLQKGFEQSNHDWEDAFGDEHFIRKEAISQANVLIGNTSPDSNAIKNAINALFSNFEVLPAMMFGVDLCFECSMNCQNIKNPGPTTNKTIMEHLFSKIKGITELNNYDNIIGYIILKYSQDLKTVGVNGYDGTENFLKIIDSRASNIEDDGGFLSSYWWLSQKEDLLTPERLSKLPNLLNSGRFIDRLIEERNMNESFDSDWYDVLRKSNIDWSTYR